VLAAISIDLDETHHYRAIHGLPPLGEVARRRSGPGSGHEAYDVAVDRALAFAREHKIALTFFAVGDDLARAENAERLRRAVLAGHVVESHSMSHRYDLSRSPRHELVQEVAASFEAIRAVVGRRPAGFRAPGYVVTDAVFDALEEVGASFDSSVFPCPAYWGAKALVMGAMAVRGRASASIVGSPRALLSPLDPYVPGRPYTRRGGRSLVEIPILVTRWGRLPVIGTTLALAGEHGARALIAACGRPRAWNVELHAMDFLDASDGLADLAPHQPELRVPLAKRLRALAATVRALEDRAQRFTTLADVACLAMEDAREPLA
jgi:hypothetical protein